MSYVDNTIKVGDTVTYLDPAMARKFGNAIVHAIREGARHSIGVVWQRDKYPSEERAEELVIVKTGDGRP